MLTDVHKNILKQHKDSRMVGTGHQYDEIITQAAEETGLPRNKMRTFGYSIVQTRSYPTWKMQGPPQN